MVAGTWRTGSLCTRCAARPRPTANARPTTAQRGPGPSGPAGNDGPPLLPSRCPPFRALPRCAPPTWTPPPEPGELGSPPVRRPLGVLARRTPRLGGAFTLWEKLWGCSVKGQAGSRPRPQLCPPGVPWPPGSNGEVTASDAGVLISRCAGEVQSALTTPR